MWGRWSDVRMVQTITTERSQHQRELWLRMVWTLNSYSLQKWYLLAVELATAAANARKEQTEYPIYHTTTLLQCVQLTTRDHYSKDKGLSLATRPSIYHQPTEAQLRVNIYCIFLFQMCGNLECIRYCIYDSTASSLCSSVFPLFHSNPAPFFLV